MASIEVVSAKVTVIEEEKIVLTLTRDEARTLAVVVDRIGGLHQGRRGHMDSIANGLNDIGIISMPNHSPNSHIVDGEKALASGYIEFYGDDNA